ncbi:MAG: hypothetical protein GYA23_11510 [Methanomicrobiales archaeon]|nr:hypothetical protein [Methanomicrobiales archaeon]
MYRVEKTAYGFKQVFSGAIPAADMAQWLEESRGKLGTVAGTFASLVDMRGLLPLLPDAQKILDDGKNLYRARGMRRSCVILDSPVITMQFRRMAKESGTDTFERYIDASTHPNYMTLAMDWLMNGKDPGK